MSTGKEKLLSAVKRLKEQALDWVLAVEHLLPVARDRVFGFLEREAIAWGV